MSTASLGTQIILSILPPSCLNWAAKPPTPCQPNEMPSPTVVTCRQPMVPYANFAPTVLSVPDGVDVRKVDLSIELQILAFHEQRKAGEEHEGAAAPAAAHHDAGEQGPDGDVPAVMPA